MGKRRGPRDSEGAQSMSAGGGGGALACISNNTPRKRRASARQSEPQLREIENVCPRSTNRGEDGQVANQCETRSSPRPSLGSAAAGKNAEGSGGVASAGQEEDAVFSAGIDGAAGRGGCEVVAGTPKVGLQQALHWQLDQIIADTSSPGADGNSAAEEFRMLVERGQTNQIVPVEEILSTLLKAYDKLRARYNKTKARRLNVEAQFEEQKQFNERFQQVADGYIQELCKENQHLRQSFEESHTQAAKNRMKLLEVLYLKCQNDNMRNCTRDTEQPQQSCEMEIAAGTKTPGSMCFPQSPTLNIPQQLPTQNDTQDEVVQHEAKSSLPEQACVQYTKDSAPQGDIDNQDNDECSRSEQEFQVNIVRTECEQVAIIPYSEGPELHEQSTQLMPAAELVVEPSYDNAGAPHDSVVMYSQEAMIVTQNLNADSHSHSFNDELQDQLSKQVTGLLSECEMLQKLLGQFMNLRVVSDKPTWAQMGSPSLVFCHRLTGFKFKLELLKDFDTQNEPGEKLAFLYRNVNLGSLARIAPWWMQEDIVLTLDQLGNFISRFHLAARGF